MLAIRQAALDQSTNSQNSLLLKARLDSMKSRLLDHMHWHKYNECIFYGNPWFNKHKTRGTTEYQGILLWQLGEESCGERDERYA